MSSVVEILDESELNVLRKSYDPSVMSSANVTALSAAYPPLKAWAEATSNTFFEQSGALAPKDRERCVIALLTYDGPALSLAVHVYWGLMEGLRPEEVCQVVALSGCYGGLPTCARGLLIAQRVLTLLSRSVRTPPCTPDVILNAIIREFQNNV